MIAGAQAAQHTPAGLTRLSRNPFDIDHSVMKRKYEEEIRGRRLGSAD